MVRPHAHSLSRSALSASAGCLSRGFAQSVCFTAFAATSDHSEKTLQIPSTPVFTILHLCRLPLVSPRVLRIFRAYSPQSRPSDFPRKEVIQPHLPVRLPCYDFVPVIRPTLGSSPLAVESPTSGVPNSHDVTGGVYKARERIHRSMADLRLLATPASCRRVAACNLNYERL